LVISEHRDFDPQADPEGMLATKGWTADRRHARRGLVAASPIATCGPPIPWRHYLVSLQVP
jgi:hypothetical protein